MKNDNYFILIVDDSNDTVLLLSAFLQSEGYKVLDARNGAEALEAAKKFRPQLILMDVSMPEVDGLDAARQVRKDPDLRHTPMIAITAFSTNGFRRAVLDAGYNVYMPKPLDLDRLSKTIKRLLAEKALQI